MVIDIRRGEGARTPPPKSRSKSFQGTPDTPLVARRSDRIRKQMVERVKDGEAITTPRGSSIHALLPKHLELFAPASPRRVEMDQLKRRLQFKAGSRSSIMLTDVYKTIERREKMKEYQEYQRGKRNSAQFKSRGLSLPAISKTREVSVLTPTKEGEAPKVQFVARRNLRPRPLKATTNDITDLLPTESQRGSIEKRRSQYKRVKSHSSLDFTNWKDRDEEWRAQRLANYMSSSKVARESTMFKKRKLELCGWGNAQRNLGNYLSICWDYNSDLDADKDQTVGDYDHRILTRSNSEGATLETGVIYYPQTQEDSENEYLNGYCFTIQSELALKYEPAQQVLFEQASALVNASFLQYNMDLSLDSSLDDEFTLDLFVSSAPSKDMSLIRVRGVTQFIFMKAYIYVDKICVAFEHQKTGIGAFLMKRLYNIARKRNKDVLLYALGPVVNIYKKWGFEYCKEWPPIEGDIGAIMRKRIRTEGVEDQYVGLEWDGTSFSQGSKAKTPPAKTSTAKTSTAA
ncbi:hypothetical protein BGX34_000518 [Mortierella sp. NVP85]|nr:hypothetical protein BGX34_000518 [Mortierella sp. NVP85]